MNRQQMDKRLPIRWILGMAALCLSGAQQGMARVVHPARDPIVLRAGVCPSISEGDIVELEWNPAFEGAAATTSLSSFTMYFARNGEERIAMRTGSGLRLQTGIRRMDIDPTIPQIVPEANGFYKMRFRVELRGAAAGEYHLIDANAEAWNAPVHEGSPLAMINNPTRMPFCLNVIEPASRGRI